MQLRTIFTLTLAVACLATSARSRKKKPLQPAISRVQAVPADSFSYAVGVAQSESLKQYLIAREGVDSAYVGEAARAILEASQLSEAEIKAKQAYAAGLRIAAMNEKQAIPSMNQYATGKRDTTYTDLRLFSQGLVDGLNGVNTLAPDSAEKIVERQISYYKETNKAANEAYLAANAKNKAFKVTPSGLQYRVLTQGMGALPADTSKVEVNYEGKLIDGTVFDSSYKRGKTSTFGLDRIIAGWKEGLKLMPEGSTYELVIPSELGYGERGNNGIPPYSTLIFKVELVKIK